MCIILQRCCVSLLKNQLNKTNFKLKLKLYVLKKENTTKLLKVNMFLEQNSQIKLVTNQTIADEYFPNFMLIFGMRFLLSTRIDET